MTISIHAFHKPISNTGINDMMNLPYVISSDYITGQLKGKLSDYLGEQVTYPYSLCSFYVIIVNVASGGVEENHTKSAGRHIG
jgi:hypothetical protein